jgi:hypothetical protein
LKRHITKVHTEEKEPRSYNKTPVSEEENNGGKCPFCEV